MNTLQANVLRGLVLAALLPFASTLAHAGEAVSVCMAPSSASMIGMSGVDAGTTVDQLVAAYLAGPALSVVPLQSRIPTHARAEASQGGCSYFKRRADTDGEDVLTPMIEQLAEAVASRIVRSR